MNATHATLERAVRQGGFTELDARGLVPLEVARATLRGVATFAKGEPRAASDDDDDDGHGEVLGADRLWAALLSLEDGREFVEVASRLAWAFHPRGFDNVDWFVRYGEAIVPFLATRLDDGVLRDQPWCVVPCLLACSSSAAFDVVWATRRVEGRSVALATAWLDRHPEAGAAYLAARAERDPRARAFLVAMWSRGDGARVAEALAAIPTGGALAFARGGAWTADAIMALLDAAAGRLVAPELRVFPSREGTGPRRCHAVRAVAARGGDDWGLALERLEGEARGGAHPARVAVFAFGSRVGARYRGVRASQRALDLGRAPAPPEAFTAYVSRAPERVWGPLEAALAPLGLAGSGVTTRVLADVGDVDAAPPSASPALRELAEFLAPRRG